MASKYLQKFPIPAGFQQILSDFTREVLRDQPSNIIQYAAQYFEMLEKGKKLQFNSKYNVKKQDKKYQLSHNAKNAEDITKKAGSITQKLNKQSNHQSSQQQAPQQSHNVSNHVSHQPSQHSHQPSQHSVSAGPSEHGDHAQHSVRGVIGTQKTVTGQQTTNYVNNLSQNIANEQEQQQQQHQNEQQQNEQQQNQQQLMDEAIATAVDKLFEQIDTDKNGYLSSKQIQRFVQLVSSQMGDFPFKAQDINEFITVVDNDRDGKISKEQLGDFILGLFKAFQQAEQ